MEKREIILNGEKYTLDYKTRTMYKGAVIGGEDLLPVRARIGDYHFIELMGNIYFHVNSNDEYYQINENESQAQKITKEIYDRARNFMKIDKENSVTKNLFNNQVILILIEEILKNRYDLSVRFGQFDTNVAEVFKKTFDSRLNHQIKSLSDQIIAEMPLYINRNELKREITKKFDEIKDQNEEYISELSTNLFNQSSTQISALKEDNLLRKRLKTPTHARNTMKRGGKTINLQREKSSLKELREMMKERQDVTSEQIENKPKSR